MLITFHGGCLLSRSNKLWKKLGPPHKRTRPFGLIRTLTVQTGPLFEGPKTKKPPGCAGPSNEIESEHAKMV